MNEIWDFAKSLEREGRDYYVTLAQETSVPELKGVFNQMADEESRHYNLFDEISKKHPANGGSEEDILGNARKAFEAISAKFSESAVINDSENAYKKALGLEKKSVQYYKDALEKVKASDARDVLGFIIGEEKKHVRIVEEIIRMVRNPKQWVEDAEFSKIDSRY
ncbi:MAG: hypothetical protein GF401_06070 [Chitinivibrionales bacterium]|nr:hypothetical protein [Chitinivibrionales bacterium]